MKAAIEDKYIIFLLFSGVVGMFTNLPKEFGKCAGTGGWVVIVMDLLFILPSSFAMISLNKHFEGRLIHEYLKDCLGKYISIPVSFLYFLRYFMLVPLMTKSLVSLVRGTVLETTPTWPLALLFIGCACYAASQSIRTLAYICQFFVSIALFLCCILFIAMFSKGELINLRPFFVKEDIPTYFNESIRNLRIFFGAGVLFMVPFSEKENKHSSKYLLIGYLLIALFYLLVFWSAVVVKNIYDTVLYDDIFFLTVRTVEIERLEILKRLDGLAIAAFIFTSLMMVAVDIYCSGMMLSYYLSKANLKVINFNISCIIISVIGFVLTIIIPDTFTLKKYLQISYIIAWMTSLIIPPLLFVIIKVKGKLKKNCT